LLEAKFKVSLPALEKCYIGIIKRSLDFDANVFVEVAAKSCTGTPTFSFVYLVSHSELFDLRKCLF